LIFAVLLNVDAGCSSCHFPDIETKFCELCDLFVGGERRQLEQQQKAESEALREQHRQEIAHHFSFLSFSPLLLLNFLFSLRSKSATFLLFWQVFIVYAH
jgi:hypothetical protein